MYSTHHEADTSRAVKTLDMLYSQKHTYTYLQQIRENSGMSVSELAKWNNIDENIIISLESDVSMIMKYDMATIFQISRALGCIIEDLLEI